MAPKSSIPYNPSDYIASDTLLPEEFFGYVELATLEAIHTVLCNSGSQDDIELGKWTRETYLDKPKNTSGAEPICTAQAFGKLDRAYRRVRSLTGKAQDKWPILDMDFKPMSSATVRNNARGESAPGVMFPIDRSQKKTCLAGQPPNGSMTPKAPELQVPFGTKKSSRYEPYVQSYPRPTQQTPAPPSANVPIQSPDEPVSEGHSVSLDQPQPLVATSQNVPKNKDLSSESDGQAMSQSEPPQSDVPKIEEAYGQDLSQDGVGTPPSTPAGDTVSFRSSSNTSDRSGVGQTVRDAGAGKIRGPNGRYLPREEDELEPKKAKKLNKGVKSRASLRNMEKRESSAPSIVPEEPKTAPAEDEDTMSSVQSPSPPVHTQKAEENNGVDDGTSIDSTTDNLVPSTPNIATPHTVANEQEVETEEEKAPGAVSTPAYPLAAEADAIPSNLDKLPPSSRKSIKRKSEPTAPSGDRKRGKNGGIVGRPRKSEQHGDRALHQERFEQGDAVKETEDPPQMITRRTTRKSAAANLNASTPAKSPVEKPLATPKEPSEVPKDPKRSSAPVEDELMGGTEEHATATHEEDPKPTSKSNEPRATTSYTAESIPPPQVSVNNLLSIGLNRTSSPALDSQPSLRQPYKSPHQSAPSPPLLISVAKKPTTNGTGSTHVPGHVEYFARITTANASTMDLPIEEDQIKNDEVKMIQKYANYNAAPDAVPVSYTQFRRIFAFAKKH